MHEVIQFAHNFLLMVLITGIGYHINMPLFLVMGAFIFKDKGLSTSIIFRLQTKEMETSHWQRTLVLNNQVCTKENMGSRACKFDQMKSLVGILHGMGGQYFLGFKETYFVQSYEVAFSSSQEKNPDPYFEGCDKQPTFEKTRIIGCLDARTSMSSFGHPALAGIGLADASDKGTLGRRVNARMAVYPRKDHGYLLCVANSDAIL